MPTQNCLASGRVNGGCTRHSRFAQKNNIVGNRFNYKCEGCKNAWDEKSFVVQYEIVNRRIFFCLNCDDWIGNKMAVFEDGWTLFDQAGQLRHDV